MGCSWERRWRAFSYSLRDIRTAFSYQRSAISSKWQWNAFPFAGIITPTLSLPEAVKKSHFHPHPVPPPSRGREFFNYFDMFTFSPRGRGQGEGEFFNFFTVQDGRAPRAPTIHPILPLLFPRSSRYPQGRPGGSPLQALKFTSLNSSLCNLS